MEIETKQLGSRIRINVFNALRALSKQERISMTALRERAIVRLLDEYHIEIKRDV